MSVGKRMSLGKPYVSGKAACLLESRMSLGKPYVSGKAVCLWERSEIEHMRLIPMNVYICKNIYKKQLNVVV